MDLTQIEHSVPPQYHFWILLGVFLISHIDRIGGAEGLVTRIRWGNNPPKQPSSDERIKAALPEIKPSAGHDCVDEVLGLLRVTRQQRDALEKEVQTLGQRIVQLNQPAPIAQAEPSPIPAAAPVQASAPNKTEP